MTPGTLFVDRHFTFHDGDEARKILVSLGTAHGITLVVKTTSQGKRYKNDFGCQSDHRFPNFHLVQNCCCLSKPTWVCLDEYYEFKDAELLQRHFSGEINRIGTLSDDLTEAMMSCALASEDISARQAAIVQSALESFRAARAQDEQTPAADN